MARITVGGDALLPGRPDEVPVSLQLIAVRPVPEEACPDVAARSEQLDTLLDELGRALRTRSTYTLEAP